MMEELTNEQKEFLISVFETLTRSDFSQDELERMFDRKFTFGQYDMVKGDWSSDKAINVFKWLNTLFE